MECWWFFLRKATKVVRMFQELVAIISESLLNFVVFAEYGFDNYLKTSTFAKNIYCLF